MKTIIPISDRYQIELDRYAWQISEWVNRKNHPNSGAYEGCYWYPRLSQACEKLVKLQLAEAELVGVEAIEAALRSSTNAIGQAIKDSGLRDMYADEHRRIGSAV